MLAPVVRNQCWIREISMKLWKISAFSIFTFKVVQVIWNCAEVITATVKTMDNVTLYHSIVAWKTVKPAVHLLLMLFWYKPCSFWNVNQNIINLKSVRSLSKQSQLQPHSRPKAWLLFVELNPLKVNLLLSMYIQLCVVQYGEFGRWSLVGVKFCLTTDSPNTVDTFCSGQVGRIKVRIFGALGIIDVN